MHTPNELLSIYETSFNSHIFNDNPATLYHPVHHIMQVKGKRIRPLLLLMSCELFGGNITEALHPAFAMEVFHNFTLVHDDIMDHAELRRGAPTVHKLYGLNAGILAGDVMLAYAYKYLTQIEPSKIPAILDVFNKTAIEIFEGQQMDIDFESRELVSEAEYLKMIEYKTSVLLACSLQAGAIIAGADTTSQQSIYSFGLNLGLAFQIKDDYLDAFGEAEKVGKRIGGDIVQNKKTFLLITAFNLCNELQRNELANLLREPEEEKKIREVKNLFEKLGVKAATEERIETFYKQAIDSLYQLGVDTEKKNMLLSFVRKVHERDY